MAVLLNVNCFHIVSRFLNRYGTFVIITALALITLYYEYELPKVSLISVIRSVNIAILTKEIE